MDLLDIQKELSVKKKQNAGRYKYRNVEEIYEAVKPLLDEPLKISTEPILVGENVFMVAKVKYKDFEVTAPVQIELNPKNMDKTQACGSAISYAVKYAICQLFCIDNSEDSDKKPVQPAQESKAMDDREKLKKLLDSEGIDHKRFGLFMKEKGLNISIILVNFGHYANEFLATEVVDVASTN